MRCCSGPRRASAFPSLVGCVRCQPRRRLATIPGLRPDWIAERWSAARAGKEDERLLLWSWLSLQGIVDQNGSCHCGLNAIPALVRRMMRYGGVGVAVSLIYSVPVIAAVRISPPIGPTMASILAFVIVLPMAWLAHRGIIIG